MAKVTCYYKVVEFEDVYGNKVRTTNIFGHPTEKIFKVVYDSIDNIPEIAKNNKRYHRTQLHDALNMSCYENVGRFANLMTASCFQKQKPTYDNILHQYLREDYDGYSDAEKQVMKYMYGEYEESFRRERELYRRISFQLEGEEKEKGVRSILDSLMHLYKLNKDAGAAAFNWLANVILEENPIYMDLEGDTDGDIDLDELFDHGPDW